MRVSSWVKVGVLLSCVWLAVLSFMTYRAMKLAPTFDEEVKGSCPQFYIPVQHEMQSMFRSYNIEWIFMIAEWRDIKTGLSINPFVKGETILRCEELKRRAKVFAQAAEEGIIDPQVRVNLPEFVFFVFLPVPILLLISFLFSSPWVKKRTPLD